MKKRTSYNDVEWEAVLQRRKGHDIRLKLKYTGDLYVILNGEIVLTDGPRDYSVALAKVRSIGMTETPTMEENDSVTDKDVHGAAVGKKAKKARAKKRASTQKGVAK